MILVTGATGLVGRPLVGLLVSAGADVRAVTRDPRRAGRPAGVEIVEGDPSRPGTIAVSLEGATATFLYSRAVGDAAFDLLALAGERGVRRAVALSAMNVEDDPADQPSRYRGDRNKEAEDAAVASGLEGVSLRASSFADNTLQAWGAQIRAGDIVRNVYAAFEESLIDERDLAAVGARGAAHRRTGGAEATADRPAVPQPREDGRHHRRRDRQAAALPADPAGGGQAGHGRTRFPRAVRRGPDGQVRQVPPAATASRHQRRGGGPRPSGIHPRRVGR